MSLAVPRARRRLLCGALLAAALAVPASAPAAPFSPQSPWNAPLASGAPLAPNSAALVADLTRQVAEHGAWINTTSYSTPIYKVAWNQPRVKVVLDRYSPPLQADFNAVPLPPDARPAAGWDRHLVVWQPHSDTMWEFWGLQKKADGWHTSWGAKLPQTSRHSGVLPAPFGATASGLALAGGVMRPFELAERNIPHALALGLPDVTAGAFTAPATRTDGTLPGGGIPEGTRFRLPASLDVNALGLQPAVKAMAIAAQRHGILIRDVSGSVSFYAEDPTPTGSNPYPKLFGTGWMDHALARFPWDRLEVVAP